MKKKGRIDYGVGRPVKSTKPGTRPNKSGERLVCVSNENLTEKNPVLRLEVMRVKRPIARLMVNIDGWKYVPKSAFKRLEAIDLEVKSFKETQK